MQKQTKSCCKIGLALHPAGRFKNWKEGVRVKRGKVKEGDFYPYLCLVGWREKIE